MKKIFYPSCVVMSVVLVSLFPKNFAPPDQVPAGVKIERFDKTAKECPEIYNNLGIIPEHKLERSYRVKLSFENSRFSPEKYLKKNSKDIAVSSYLGDGKVLVTILTDNYCPESHRYVASR